MDRVSTKKNLLPCPSTVDGRLKHGGFVEPAGVDA